VITYTNGVNSWSNGILKVIIPAGWSPPGLTGTDPGFFTAVVSGGTKSGMSRSGQVITVNCSSLNAFGTITVTYGSRASGGPGATVQPGEGNPVFTVEMNPITGTTYPIASSPQVLVSFPTPTSTFTRTYTATPTVTTTSTNTPSVTPTNTPLTGEGTASINPLSVMAGGTGNTLVIDYTAGPTAWGTPSLGTLRITIPAGWSAPDSIAGTSPGYFTASASGGSISGVSALGMDIVVYVSSLNANTGHVTIAYGSRTGGGPGATAQGSMAAVEFTVKSAVSGTTVNRIASPPQLIVAAATMTATRTVTPTYTITPDTTPVKPSGMTAQQAGNNVTLNWNTSATADYYRVYMASGVTAKTGAFPASWSLIATVLPTPGTSSFAQTETAGDYIYYAVAAVNGAGQGGPSTMVSKVRKVFTFNTGMTNTFRVGLPYNSKYATAQDIVADIEGNTYSSSKISNISIWNPLSQSFTPHNYVGGSWKLPAWNVDAGTASSNAVFMNVISSFTWVTAGTDKTAGLYFRFNSAGTQNMNVRMLPYAGIYTKASDVVLDIEGNTFSANRIRTVAVWNTASQSYRAYLYNGSKWVLPDVSINPGDAVLIGLSGVTQEFTWTPKIIMTPVP
jgi:hypothetical protein